MEYNKEKTFELFRRINEMQKPENFKRRCDESVPDLAMSAKWMANDLRPIAFSRAKEWDQIALAEGFDARNCPGYTEIK